MYRSKRCGKGWIRTDNPHYEVDFEASGAPWLVPTTIWTRKWPGGSVERIAKCYDPRPGLECWCFRVMRYDDERDCWEWANPGRKRVPFFDRLSAAQSAMASFEDRDWWTR